MKDLVSRPTHLYDQVQDVFWSKIYNGEIVPGQRLKDVEWAKRLGVSRTPVREAMRKMEQEGILLPLPNGGYEVRPVSDEDEQALFRCRTTLELQAVREAAGCITRKDTQQFEMQIRLSEDALEQRDLDKLLKLNIEFHQNIINLSRNVHLVNLYETVKKLLHYYVVANLNRIKSDPALQEIYIEQQTAKVDVRRAIVSKIFDGDVEGASELVRNYTSEPGSI